MDAAALPFVRTVYGCGPLGPDRTREGRHRGVRRGGRRTGATVRSTEGFRTDRGDCDPR